MKNIKKLFISMIAIVLLASCNIASSSGTSIPDVSSNSSAVSSTTTPNQQVGSITLSTSSSTTQFVGLTSRVLINASLDVDLANAKLEWYLDGALSATQTGLAFEFTPIVAREYAVYAKIGNVISNTIRTTVDSPSFNLLGFKIINSNTIEVTSEASVVFSVAGLTISNASTYNITNQKYTINFLSPMIQGNSYILKANKVGFKEVSYPFVFETRKLEVGYLLYDGEKVKANANGVYELARPFSGADLSYALSLAHTNLEGTNVPVSILTTVPASADAIAPFQSTITIQKGINISRTYTLTTTTKDGLYVHNVNVNGVTLTVNVSVKIPTPEIKLGTVIVYDVATPSGNAYTPMATPFAKDAEGEYVKDVITPQTDGSYIIYRPYNGLAFELTFNIEANNFATPVGFPAQGDPFNFLTAISGPTGSLIFFSNTANTIVSQFPFRESLGSNYRISQYIDNKTTTGTYNIVFSVASGTTSYTKTLRFIVREYAPTITPVIAYNDQEVEPNSDGSYTIFKPLETNQLAGSIKFKVENFESPLQSQTVAGPGFNTLYLSTGSTYRYYLNYRAVYSGPLSGVVASTSKFAVELGKNSGTDDTVASFESTPVTYPRFNSTTSSELVDVTLIEDDENYENANIFDPMLTLTSASFPGTHIYTVTIGTISRQIIFRIEEARPDILIKDTSVKFGPSAGNVSENNAKLNETDGKYYVNGKNGYLDVEVYPFGMISGTYPYTFTRLTPSGSFQSTTNTVLLSLRVNVGSPGSYTERYDGTLKFPASGQGSEMKFNIKLAEEGEYVFTFNINNVTKQVKVVVLPSPELRVETLTYNDQELVYNGNFFYVNHATVERFFELTLNPLNIEDDYKFAISTDGAIPTTATKNEISIVNGKVTTGFNFPITSGAEVTTDFYIMLFKGDVRVGEVTKIVIKSQPVYVSTYYDLVGGTIANPIGAEIQYVGGSLTAPNPAPTKTNFDFGGWYSDPGYTSATKINFGSYVVPEMNVVLYAKWLTRYSITYNLNGGLNDVGNPTTFNTETQFTLLLPTKANSTFQGWYLESALTNEITDIEPGRTANLVLYAKWNP